MPDFDEKHRGAFGSADSGLGTCQEEKVSPAPVDLSDLSWLGALAFERGDIGLVSMDATGQVVRANPYVLKLLGSPSEATTQLFNLFELTTFSPALRKEFKEALLAGRKHEALFDYTSMHGRRAYLKMVSTPLMDGDSFQGAFIQLFDMSAMKAAEDQLRRTSKMESLSLLASSLAHDLNNVFTALVGYSSLLRKPGGLPPSRHDHALEMIEKASMSGAKLVENLLSFTSERNAHLPSCHFEEAFRQAVALFSCGLTSEIEVVSHSSVGDVRIRGSANKLEHLIINLALNARDAILPHSGTIRIDASLVDSYPPDCLLRVTARGKFVQLTVSDTGCGIRSENLHRIFDPYFSTKAPGRGTGLGLSSVWGILKELGGTIRVVSKVNEGSSFSIYLPLSSNQDEALAEPRVVRDLMGAGQRILLVEGDQDLGTLLVWVLLRHGYKVIHCASALQAMGVVESGDPQIDAIVCGELALSNPQGPFMQRIATAGLPLLRLTSRSILDNAQEHQFALVKPFTPERFLEAVAQLFSP